MIDRLLGRVGRQESQKAYIPKIDDIEKEVLSLVARSSHDRFLQNRISYLAGTSSGSEFSLVKSKEFGGNVFIMIPGRADSVLRISAGKLSGNLMGISRSKDKLKYWELESGEIKNRADLGNGVEKIVFGRARRVEHSFA